MKEINRHKGGSLNLTQLQAIVSRSEMLVMQSS